jgi:CheY-like chemotaxis protein
VRAAADQQLARASIDRKDEWVRERMAEFRRGDTTAEIEWNDGRWVQLLERRTSDGGTVSLRFDITERKRTEEQLRRAQRLESVGQLTGGIAHDFNNLLAVIIGNLEMAGEDHVAQDIKRELLSQALQAALRGAELTQRLLAFSRRQPLNPRAVDIEETILSMRELLRRTLGETITVDIAARERPWPCLADPVQLESALLNLAIKRARRHARRRAHRHRDRQRDARRERRRPAGRDRAGRVHRGLGHRHRHRHVGGGAAPRLRAVLHHQGRRQGQRTRPQHGLRLRQAVGRQRHDLQRTRPRHDGEALSATRAAAAGAGEASASAAATTPAPSTSPAGTVLVVEDQDEVRVLVERQFTALGFTVHQAADAAAALAMLEAHPEIALLFTDIILPGGMTGLQLAEEALRRWPRSRCSTPRAIPRAPSPSAAASSRARCC